MSQNRILILEDNPELRRLYNKLLSDAGYNVHEASTIYDAEKILDQHHIAIFLCDIRLDAERGSDLLERRLTKLQARGTRVIVISAEAHYRTLTDQLGADFFMTKPVNMDSLLTLVNRLSPTAGEAA